MFLGFLGEFTFHRFALDADRIHLRHDYSFSPTDSPGDVVSRMKYLHPIFELRQKWSYNNQVCVSRRIRLIVLNLHPDVSTGITYYLHVIGVPLHVFCGGSYLRSAEYEHDNILPKRGSIIRKDDSIMDPQWEKDSAMGYRRSHAAQCWSCRYHFKRSRSSKLFYFFEATC